MSTIIKSVGISDFKGFCTSVDHAVRASRRCIEMSGIDKGEIDLLIHVGIYREDNIFEPAIATLIQQQLDINGDPATKRDQTKTFSFDLVNGGCGLLYAAQVADSFLKNGARKLALITSSDIHPSRRPLGDFPFTHSGAAVLLEYSEQEEKGFKKFMYNTCTSGDIGIDAHLNLRKAGFNGRMCMEVNVRDDYVRRLKELTADTIKKHVESGDINLSDLKFIITSQPNNELSKGILESVDLNGVSCIDIYDDYGDLHTSTLSTGFFLAKEKGIFQNNDNVLFISGASGITVALGLYIV